MLIDFSEIDGEFVIPDSHRYFVIKIVSHRIGFGEKVVNPDRLFIWIDHPVFPDICVDIFDLLFRHVFVPGGKCEFHGEKQTKGGVRKIRQLQRRLIKHMEMRKDWFQILL